VRRGRAASHFYRGKPSPGGPSKGNRGSGPRLIPAVHQVIEMSNWKHINRASLAAISFAVALVCVGVLVMLGARSLGTVPSSRRLKRRALRRRGQAAEAAGAHVLAD